MRGFFAAFVALAGLPLGVGCERLIVGTRVVGAVETRLDAPPVSLSAGGVKPVVVQGGPVRVALVDVDGLILNTPFVGPLSVGENPVALFREKLEAIACDRTIKAVVLRINSPGGGVAACISMRHDLERFKERTSLPVVACLLDTATGGAYYLATAATQVVAGPATVTGGIGVILNLYNLQDTMALINVSPQFIKAGKLTDLGGPTHLMTKDEKAILQAMGDEFHTQIIADVKRSRPAATDDAVFDGRVFTGAQAQAKGLVDAIGDLDQTLQVAAELACPGTTARPCVVMYRRGNDPARSVYAVTPNVPLQGTGLLPSVPGIDRAKLPTFLSVWPPEPSLEKQSGK
jgi:protease-4